EGTARTQGRGRRQSCPRAYPSDRSFQDPQQRRASPEDAKPSRDLRAAERSRDLLVRTAFDDAQLERVTLPARQLGQRRSQRGGKPRSVDPLNRRVEIELVGLRHPELRASLRLDSLLLQVLTQQIPGDPEQPRRGRPV